LACIFIVVCFGNRIFAASYKISNNADFIAGSLSEEMANDPDGAASNYVRLFNNNPGRYGNPGNILATLVQHTF